MKIEVLMAWPRRHRETMLELADGAAVQTALERLGWPELPEISGYAVWGRRVERDHVLEEGDRLELLRPLAMDPMQARRQRAWLAKALRDEHARR